METPSLNITTLSEFDIKENFPPNFIQGLSSSGKTSRITKKMIWTKMIELFKVYRVQCTCSCPCHLPCCLQLLLKLLLPFPGEEKHIKPYTWCLKKVLVEFWRSLRKLNCTPKRDYLPGPIYFSECRRHRKGTNHSAHWAKNFVRARFDFGNTKRSVFLRAHCDVINTMVFSQCTLSLGVCVPALPYVGCGILCINVTDQNWCVQILQ